MGLYICTKKKRPDLILPRNELINRQASCRVCGKPYSWRVQLMRQFEKPGTEEEDNYTRACALWQEYRSQEIGPCCAKPEHRNFISRHAGCVVYY